jgi:hypothetical protein
MIELRSWREGIHPMAGIAPATVFSRVELTPMRRLVAVGTLVVCVEAELGDPAGREQQGGPFGGAGLLELHVAPDARRGPMGAFQCETEPCVRGHVGCGWPERPRIMAGQAAVGLGAGSAHSKAALVGIDVARHAIDLLERERHAGAADYLGTG